MPSLIGWLCIVLITFPVYIGINIVAGMLSGCQNGWREWRSDIQLLMRRLRQVK